MNEIGFELLRNAIVMQAVYDYCTTVRHIAYLKMKCYAINKIVADGKKGRCPKSYSLEEVEEERLHRIMMKEATLQQIENFFNSEWYKNLCAIDSDYIIKATRQKAIDEMVNKCIFDLKRVKDKNINTKIAQKRLFEFEVLKNFLCSEYLPKLTDQDAKDILKYIKDKTKCKHCDFSV